MQYTNYPFTNDYIQLGDEAIIKVLVLITRSNFSILKLFLFNNLMTLVSFLSSELCKEALNRILPLLLIAFIICCQKNGYKKNAVSRYQQIDQ